MIVGAPYDPLRVCEIIQRKNQILIFNLPLDNNTLMRGFWERYQKDF